MLLKDATILDATILIHEDQLLSALWRSDRGVSVGIDTASGDWEITHVLLRPDGSVELQIRLKDQG